MTIETTKNGNEINLHVMGRLDTTTAPQLELECKKIGDISLLIMDFDGLDYVSSAGLRVILAAQKIMAKQGKLIIKNVNETIMEVFEVTGFSDILNIEKA